MLKSESEHLSPHFTVYNLTRNGACYEHNLKNIPTKAQRKSLEILCNYVLEPLWHLFYPITIAKGFMTRQVAWWNNIDHSSGYCRGEAVDIVCGNCNRAHFMYTFCKLNLKFNEMYFLPSENEPRFLHINFNPDFKNECKAGPDVVVKKTRQ